MTKIHNVPLFSCVRRPSDLNRQRCKSFYTILDVLNGLFGLHLRTPLLSATWTTYYKSLKKPFQWCLFLNFVWRGWMHDFQNSLTYFSGMSRFCGFSPLSFFFLLNGNMNQIATFWFWHWAPFNCAMGSCHFWVDFEGQYENFFFQNWGTGSRLILSFFPFVFVERVNGAGKRNPYIRLKLYFGDWNIALEVLLAARFLAEGTSTLLPLFSFSFFFFFFIFLYRLLLWSDVETSLNFEIIFLGLPSACCFSFYWF